MMIEILILFLYSLQGLSLELKTQDEQAEGVLEDLRLLTCISSGDGLETLCVAVIQLQEEVKNTQLLLTEAEEQTQRNVQDVDRYQTLYQPIICSLSCVNNYTQHKFKFQRALPWRCFCEVNIQYKVDVPQSVTGIIYWTVFCNNLILLCNFSLQYLGNIYFFLL